MDELYEILEEIIPTADYRNSERLVDDKILTSLNLLKLVARVNETFDVRITPVHLVPENFNSARAIYALIEKLE